MASEKQLPRDISLEPGKKHDKFRELIESKLSPFYKKTMKDVFMYALGIGFLNGKRLELQKKVGTIPLRTLSEDDEALIKAIAVTEKGSLDVLYGENIKDAFDIAEEYANRGIDTLYSLVFGDEPGDPDRKMEQSLRDIISESQESRLVSKPVTKSNSELLKDFESEVRAFIQKTLEEAVGENWWRQSIPSDVQEKCKERKEKRDRLPWMDEEDYPLICYADFDDYFKIITRRDNWRNIFSPFFIDEAWIKT